MAKFVRLTACPRCREKGKDRSGDNLGEYADGSAYCFSCGYKRAPSFRLKRIVEENFDDAEKAVLPRDFQREVPTEYWKWLLQYGLTYEYWRPFTGFTEREKRIVFTIGNPTRFSIGRTLDLGKSKWKIYGDKSNHVEVIGEQISGEVVLVEDIISAHKAGQVVTTIPLFGTTIGDNIMKRLVQMNRPVALWLDNDQYGNLARKLGKIKVFNGQDVRYIRTDKDPKSYTLNQIKEILT